MLSYKRIIQLVFFISTSIWLNTANSALHCNDVTSDNDRRIENMERLAEEARLTSNYFNRYHEAVVSDLCKGKEDDIEFLIDTGYVKGSEVQSIKEILGLDKQYLNGIKHQETIKKLSNMGLSSASAGNVAYSYRYEPKSKCGQLAKSALEGNLKAIKILQNSPEYCK